MEALAAILPIIIYFLLIVLLVVVIILGIKIIITVDMINDVIDDVREKVDSLNNIFGVINFATDKISNFGTRIFDTTSSIVNKIFGIRSRKDDDYA